MADHNLHVTDTGGDGRPVVLIHGWPLSGESWSEQVPALKDAGYRVVYYDRRGFGQSDPGDAYDYDALADDLGNVLTDLDLNDATIVGFSMGGGEVARYIAKHGEDRIHSAVFAAAVPPYLPTTEDNPEGPLDDATQEEFTKGINGDRDEFFDGFVTSFYSVDGTEVASKEQHAEALALAKQSDEEAAKQCMAAFASTDFRDDLTTITVPTLVIHGDSDAVVPFEGSGKRTHETVSQSELVLVDGAPHGFNVTHPAEFNTGLLAFLAN